jgi:hypothetical protein
MTVFPPLFPHVARMVDLSTQIAMGSSSSASSLSSLIPIALLDQKIGTFPPLLEML